VIFANGLIADYSLLTPYLDEDDYVVAADGGASYCAALGITPHLIIGDLDSIAPQLLERFSAQGSRVERFPPAKDQTDLELALEHAVSLGAGEVLLFGVTGGRLDQTLANLLILAQRPWGARVRVVDGAQVAELLSGPGEIVLGGTPGSLVSVIPISSVVQGVTYHGLRYPLRNAVLSLGSTRGVSNVIARQPATIEISAGLLLVIEEHQNSA
jgi:thiamine pyrophosphokinase